MSKTKICPHCGKPFECREDDIHHCHCSRTMLNEASREFINSHYADCLCHDCLKEINTKIIAEQKTSK